MNSSLVIRVRRRSQQEWTICYIILMPFLFYFLMDLLRLPSVIKYTLDACWLFLLLSLAAHNRKTDFRYARSYIWVGVFFLTTLFWYFVSFQSPFFYLWGLRINFRYYILFFACIVYMSTSDIEAYLELFDKLFWVNAAVIALQYTVFGFYGDWLGGLFGTEKGCNSGLNIFYVIMMAKTVLFYIAKYESLRSCVVKIAIMVITAAAAELKFFYLECFLIFIFAEMFSEFSWRKLSMVLLSCAFLFIGVNVLVLLFPNASEILSFDAIIKYSGSSRGYSGAKDINRLTAIAIISDRFLETLPQKLFGLGLGNCDTGAISLVATPFYREYSYLHYGWFSSASVFLEMGYIGILFVIGFFGNAFYKGISNKYETQRENVYCQLAAIVAICCIAVFFYDNTLRREFGYIAYFVVSFPSIIQKTKQRKK